jgi:2-dehydropantoate 2-reductase
MVEPDTEKPFVIWGAGAMGGSIGADLARAGVPMVFVDTDQAHVDAMNDRGLTITGPVASFTTPVSAHHPDDLAGRYDTVFLCVKAHHTREAAEALLPFLAPDGAVVSIQNGLCELNLEEIVGRERTVGAFVNFGADYLEPGVVHRGNRGATVVGELDGTVSDRVGGIHRLLTHFEPNAVLTENIFGFLWGKLGYAALLFATALTDDSIADVLAHPVHRPTLVELAREVMRVANARGVRLEGFDGFDPEAFAPHQEDPVAHRSLDALVAFNRASAKTHSGIWRDLAVRKRKTEVDAQLGWVVRFGRESGVPTPLTEAVVQQIHEIESGERALCWENLAELGGTT